MALNKDSWHEERMLINGKLVEAEGEQDLPQHQPGE